MGACVGGSPRLRGWIHILERAGWWPAPTRRGPAPTHPSFNPPSTGGGGPEGVVLQDVKRSSPATPPPQARHRTQQPRAADNKPAPQAQQRDAPRRESQKRGKKTRHRLA
ncbi:hypothetical protein GCM10009864_77460 [Streptomyces lunalinharesii]|uniref:Transposase n=1 Tax=Streptomyces lunalinharesii TaxID=333384 RepID=A0ABP6FG82_9ACTN